ncbi:phospholipid-translocating P-type ATPase domain-containing protein [Metarhizium robertsii ARSEF 23]|uniref:Calcium-transporting ATPase n=1 Tax=Metarhizium robertsii (strain ARSEF 23 / ATCC MYA-3075) TaxID=655844 RepID=E9EQ51_METRA|nr:phospholipid-translocating P-type ATPase domain-containing protein [Metarhizium robertsii ARSEF 23]EFZ02515.1 phospholipid-translocating P-type ATPase domain-containing protein [Metarhizium robertsii ARSEF 23]
MPQESTESQPQPQPQPQPQTMATPISTQDDTVSPSTIVEQPPFGFNSQRSELQADTSFDSRENRPTSPHNVSSPVLSRTHDGGAGFLSVPNHLRSRQNSVDSDDVARSVTSHGDTTVVASSYTQTDKLKASGNEKIMKDTRALNPDTGTENDFKVDNNPFAFTPGQLNKMFNPKSLSAFFALGGMRGLEKGLRSDRKSGLSSDETFLDGEVTFDQATAENDKKATEGAITTTAAVARMQTNKSRGNDSFADRYRVFRDNRLPVKKGKSLLELMWITYNDKVLILLSIAAVISLGVGLYQTFGQSHGDEPAVEWVEGVAIIVAIAIVVIVGSLNDYSKERQFAKLNKKKQDRNIKVIRSGQISEISVFDIMVGDVVHLEPGDLVPVDGVLIDGFNVKCDESQTTGESDIIRKRPADEVYQAIQNNESLKKMDPFIQSGARIMEGVGTYMATSTGIYSSYGRTLMALNEDPEMTPLQAKLNVIATYIAKLGGAAGLLLFLVLFIEFLVRLPKLPDSVTPAQKGQNFLEIFIVVVTIIVVAVPEGLPLAVTLALAFATTRMLKDANLVRHLKACEVMGNATTICSDKTGTLTQNKMQVVAGTIGTAQRFGAARPDSQDSSDESVEAEAATEVSAAELTSMLSAPVKDLLLKSIALNSTAFEGEVDGEQTFIGSKTETALLLLARAHLGMGPVSQERDNATTLQIIPFDSGRKCMGIVVQLPTGGARLYVKGASEILLAKCTRTLSDPSTDDSVTTLSAQDGKIITELIETYASRSLRTIGICYRDFEVWPPKSARRGEGGGSDVEFNDLFQEMSFIAMVGIQDPLREGVYESVKLCQKAGVVVRMVTGDNKLTAQAIAKECGILQPNSIVMEGPDFRNLSKREQEKIIPQLHVLARSSPEDKRILVKRLKDKGETVAVTGDGTNDAPALKMADVGFSMGIAGTEVAKEASAIILMDDNFASIVKALKWGRAVNDAVKRFLQFQLTVNITAVVLTFVTAVSSETEKSVLTAVQLLWVNLIMDTLAALALATDPPQDSVLDRKPEPKGASIISITMWKMIIGQALYQLAITFLLYYGSPKGILPLPGPDDIPEPDQINTLVFNTFVWMQIFNQWNNRRLDNKFNIFEGLSRNWFFIGISIIMCAGQVIIIFFGGAAFHIADQPEDKAIWGTLWAIAIVLGFISIPVGVIIRLVPDWIILALVPEFLKKRSHSVPGLTISDEEMEMYPEPLAELRDELNFLRRVKGGRLNNLKFAIQHPRETILQRSRSPSHSRSNSMHAPQTPTGEENFGSPFATPNSGAKSGSNRSRSNSAVRATALMAGVVAAGVGAGWSPAGRVSAEEMQEGSNNSNNKTVEKRNEGGDTSESRKRE